LLVQTAPDAYEDEELIAEQKKVHMSIMYFDPNGGDKEQSHCWNASQAFHKAGHRNRFYQIFDKRALPQILQREIRKHVHDPDFDYNTEGKNE